MKTTLSKLIKYLNSSGFWFMSNSEIQGDATKKAIKKGIIQPIENLGIGYKSGKKSFFYVSTKLKSKHEIPGSLHNHFISGISC